VAWVTGAGSGIGRACARRLASDGADVVAIDVDLGAVQAVAEEIGGVAVECDVADADAVRSVAAQLVEWQGPPDIVVCAAGIGHSEPVAGHDEEGWQRVLAVNLSGPFHLLREVTGAMGEQGWGRIVNISSGAGVRTGPATGAYGSSKAGLIALTKALANELAENGVTVNAIAPGLVDTAMTRRLMPSDEMMAAAAKKSRAASPIGVPLQPEDIAHAVAFLCHPDSWGITGQTLHVNGGSVMP
jgi:NAD(P)-dependent dehydrogenase (short-subunit alcohol dehydrogenase family)